MQQNEAEVLDLFIRAIAHDIAAPFRTIGGAAAILMKEREDTEILPLIVDAATEGAAQLETLVSTMRVFLARKCLASVQVNQIFLASSLKDSSTAFSFVSDDLSVQFPEGVFEQLCEHFRCVLEVWAENSQGEIKLTQSADLNAVELCAEFKTVVLRPRAADRFFVPVKQNYVQCTAGHVPLGFMIKATATNLGGTATFAISEDGLARLGVTIPF